MRRYDKKLADTLTVGSLIQGEIVIKPIPDSMQAGTLDKRERDFLIETEEAMSALPPPKSLDEIRGFFGCANFDLCETCVSQKYVDMDFGHGNCRIWVYQPQVKADKAPALLYLHGGAFFAGSAEVFHNPMRLLAERGGCVVFNLEYNRAPELKYPGQIDEAVAALDHIICHCDEYGVDACDISICGDSAGASIALAASMRAGDRLKRQILFYPVVDFVTDGILYEWREDFYDIHPDDRSIIVPELGTGRIDGKGDIQKMMMTANLYLKEDRERMYHDVSPLYADVSDLPETVLMLSEFDGLRISQQLFMDKLVKSGVKAYGLMYRGVVHAFFEKLGIIPQAEAAIDELADIIKGGLDA